MNRVLLVAAVLLPATANAVPTAKVIPGPAGALGQSRCGGFAEDSLKLIVEDGSSTLGTIDFCSSYAKATARVVTDSRGVSYVLLRFAEGRGTHATSEVLTVYSVTRGLVEYLQTPISGPTGPLSSWSYRIDVTILEHGGVRLSLKLTQPGSGDAVVASPEQTRAIVFGTS